MSTIINARSPYYIKVEPATGTLSSASMSLYIYSGTFTTDKPGTPQYTISKDIIGSNNYVIYEITELIRDYLNTEYATGHGHPHRHPAPKRRGGGAAAEEGAGSR